MKFCPDCGTKRIDNAKFCHECGYKFSISSQENSNKQESKLQIQTETLTTKEKYINFRGLAGYTELMSICKNLQKLDFSSVRVVFEGQIKRGTQLGKVAEAIKRHFNYNYFDIAKFVLSEMENLYGHTYDDNGYFKNSNIGVQHHNYLSTTSKKQNKSSDSFLDAVELILDFSSPTSAIKRLIKEIKK
jgi:zinc-ribbon domain